MVSPPVAALRVDVVVCGIGLVRHWRDPHRLRHRLHPHLHRPVRLGLSLRVARVVDAPGAHCRTYAPPD
eukprot:2593522-Pleurochrysis_carterae.AAC.7